MWIEGSYVAIRLDLEKDVRVARVVVVFDVQRIATTKVEKEEIHMREIETDHGNSILRLPMVVWFKLDQS
nr:hypothetical protein [Tanacetum cinerariifolium]